MSSNKAKVSIIMPTFNRAHLIMETLESIKNQTYKNWECLIIDDGSTDNTKEVLLKILESDFRFQYFERSKEYLRGPSGCRNQGLDLASGEFIIFFDSDDIIHPENLQICVNVLNRGNFKFCRYDKSPFRGEWGEDFPVDNENFELKTFSIGDISKMVTMEAGFACCTVMWRNSSLDGLEFDEKLSYAEEWEYYTRLLSQGLSGASINKVLYYNRKHSGSNTGEFWANNPIRRASKLLATKKVIITLAERKLLSPELTHYFIRLGFFLEQKPVIDLVLKKSGADCFNRLKYTLGYKLYPVIKPIFNFKSKFLIA